MHRFALLVFICCQFLAAVAAPVGRADTPPGSFAGSSAPPPPLGPLAWVKTALDGPQLSPAAVAPPGRDPLQLSAAATAPHPATTPAATRTEIPKAKKNVRTTANRRPHHIPSTDQSPAQMPPLFTAATGNAAVETEPSFWSSLLTSATTETTEALPPLRAGVQPPKPPGEEPMRIESVLTKRFTQQEKALPRSSSDTEAMLASLVELQKNIQQEITVTRQRLKTTTSDAEKATLQEELKQLDQQLSDSAADFERIATGVEPTVFIAQKDQGFSWKDELTTLLEPTIKELKQLTARARQKTQLKEEVLVLGKQMATANR
ncbi:MAG: hypothetical protein RBT36_09190, partial [Desulfobulbus sp.]|nr:hypothetical protein [Desulfobulbus sp.]